MPRKDVIKKFEELESWFINMDRKAVEEAMQIVGRMLASLPGGDEFEDLGFEPYAWLGWNEFEAITDALQIIESKEDVETAIATLMPPDEDEE